MKNELGYDIEIDPYSRGIEINLHYKGFTIFIQDVYETILVIDKLKNESRKMKNFEEAIKFIDGVIEDGGYRQERGDPLTIKGRF